MVNYSVAEGVSFKSPVYLDDDNKTIRQVDRLGITQRRLVPTYAMQQDKIIMDIMIAILRNPGIAIEEKIVWAKHAKDFEKGNLDKHHLSLRTHRKEFSDKIWLMTLEALGLDPMVAKAHPEFSRFIKVNHLDKMIKNHGHKLQIADGEPCILFYGKPAKWSAIKDKLKLDPKTKLGLDLKALGWSYLGESDFCPGGLVHYSSATWKFYDIEGHLVSSRPLPYGKMTPQEKAVLKDDQGAPLALPYIQNFADCRATKFPEKALENNDHCFTKLVDPEGNIWFFGFTCQETRNKWEEVRKSLASNRAIVESPDRYADVPPAIRESVILPCDVNQFKAEFDFFVKKHENGDVYNLVDNCVDAVCGANEAAGLYSPGDSVKVEFYKLFPKPLQKTYQMTPLPSEFKRAFARKFLLGFMGYNSGDEVNGQQISLRNMKFPVDSDLMVSHPRLVREEMIRHKQESDSKPEKTEEKPKTEN